MNHSELIARLRGLTGTLKSGAWSTIAEAADALQALERVPMTDREIAGAWIKLADPIAFGSKFQNDSQVREFTRAIEAHHGITPPESKG